MTTPDTPTPSPSGLPTWVARALAVADGPVHVTRAAVTEQVLAWHMRQERQRRSWSLRELASVMDLSRSVVSRMERGRLPLHLRHLVAACGAWQMPVGDLLCRAERAQDWTGGARVRLPVSRSWARRNMRRADVMVEAVWRLLRHRQRERRITDAVVAAASGVQEVTLRQAGRRRADGQLWRLLVVCDVLGVRLSELVRAAEQGRVPAKVVRLGCGPSQVSYWEIAAEVTQQIAGGVFAAGERLPSQTRLARQYGVSPQTVHAAYKVVISNGLAMAKPRVGCFVV